MINILPPDYKENIIYGRRNASLVRWATVCILVIIAMGATVLAGMFYIENSKNTLADSLEVTKQSIKDENLEDIQKQATQISGGVKLIVQILSSEIQFSKLLNILGKIMPEDTSLAEIQLSNTIAGGIDITALATDYQSASQVQINLSDPNNGLFDKVDTISIVSQPGNTTSRYGYRVTLRATFKKDAAVTLLGSPAKNGAAL